MKCFSLQIGCGLCLAMLLTACHLCCYEQQNTSACAGQSCKPEPCKNAETEVPLLALPPVIDGDLNDSAWQKAAVLELRGCGGDAAGNSSRKPSSGIMDCGNVRVVRDKDYLYLGFDFQDMDVQAHCRKDQGVHFQYGDVAEVFLKPANGSWYWELYVSPLGYKTAIFYPGGGHRGLRANLSETSPLKKMKTAASINGSLNQPFDVDSGWTAEMAIPIDELSALGIPFGDTGATWKMLVGRYNYSRYAPLPELSSYPDLPLASPDFHRNDLYTTLIFGN